jgi:hypothetical protein
MRLKSVLVDAIREKIRREGHHLAPNDHPWDWYRRQLACNRMNQGRNPSWQERKRRGSRTFAGG